MSVSCRGLLVGLVVLTTVGVSACSANRAPSSAGPTNGQTTIPAATASASPAITAAASLAPTTSPTPASSGGVQNLVSNSTVRSDLTGTFLESKGVPLSEVAGGGPMPGSVYYAYDRATGTYWAAAGFTPINTLSLSELEAFQNGGDIGMFQKAGAGPWHVQTGASSLTCLAPHFFPVAVLIAWSLPTTPSCKD
ncbi:MAG TPA: hypothetical protein VI365_02300 [Trebonia sp.]